MEQLKYEKEVEKRRMNVEVAQVGLFFKIQLKKYFFRNSEIEKNIFNFFLLFFEIHQKSEFSRPAESPRTSKSKSTRAVI